MASTPIDLPSGILKRESPVAAAGRYIDAQWVRFRDGKPEKIGGYIAMFAEVLTGLVRGMFGWTTKAGSDVIAAGTYAKLYSTSDTVDDITPIDASGTLGNNPFVTTNTSKSVKVKHTSHGRVIGSLVRFSGAAAVGGITISGEYPVATVVDTDNYTIEHSAAATSSATGGGASVAYEYELNIGLTQASFGLGWGAGGWSVGTWGTARDFSSAVTLELRHWFFGRYGSTLLALPSGGTLYQWDQPSNADHAVAVSGAPASARAMFVTSERFPVLLGTTTPMTIQWPDQDDITDWTPTATNTANSRNLQNGSKLIAGVSLGELVSLVWSDTSVYLMQYTGSDFIYDTRLVSDAAGLIAPGAFATAFGTAYWLSKAGFLMYQGGIANISRSDEIRDYVLNGMNPERTQKIWCAYNPKYREIWWGYCSAGQDEPDRYVMVSLDDFSWTVGALDRTSASHNQSPSGTIVMAGTDSLIYGHETGLDANGLAIEAYIQTGRVALRGADLDNDIVGFVPDFERQTGDLTLSLDTFHYPQSSNLMDSVDETITEGAEIADLHLSGRYAQLLMTSNVLGGDFRFGVPQLVTEQGGER